MAFWISPVSGALLLALGLGLCGCLPTGRGQMDEEKEPHFLDAKRRLTALDNQGALDGFEKALEANPRSALAHFEAGLLYEKYKQDHAAAIYHFERFLQSRPGSGYAEIVRLHILACKQELAKAVSLGPVSQSLQRDIEQLTQQNKVLLAEVEAWRAKARAQNWGNPPAQLANSFHTGQNSAAALPVPPPTSTPSLSNLSSSSRVNAPTAPGRMHTVKSGETPYVIARKYSVRVDSLMAANPRVDARRLRVGQTLSVPTQ
jgi:hypothetical protein